MTLKERKEATLENLRTSLLETMNDLFKDERIQKNREEFETNFKVCLKEKLEEIKSKLDESSIGFYENASKAISLIVFTNVMGMYQERYTVSFEKTFFNNETNKE